MKPEFRSFIPRFLLKTSPSQTHERHQTDTSGITPEIAKADIERAVSVFATIGQGSAEDRAAQMVLQTIQVASHRLDRPQALKLLYTNNPETKRMLPTVVSSTIDRVVKGEISAEEGRKILEAAVPKYIEVFQSMGITPKRISVLFSKANR